MKHVVETHVYEMGQAMFGVDLIPPDTDWDAVERAFGALYEEIKSPSAADPVFDEDDWERIERVAAYRNEFDPAEMIVLC